MAVAPANTAVVAVRPLKADAEADEERCMNTDETAEGREESDPAAETTWYGTWQRADGGRIEISGPRADAIPIRLFLEEAVKTAVAFFGADGVRKLVDEDDGRTHLV